MTQRTHYIVVGGLGPSDLGPRPPHPSDFIRHGTEEVAISEARRLARENPGYHFTVYAAVVDAKVSDIEFVRYDDMPF